MLCQTAAASMACGVVGFPTIADVRDSVARSDPYCGLFSLGSLTFSSGEVEEAEHTQGVT
jgi:hypothetical protein